MEIRSWPFIIFHRDPVLLSRNVDHCTATQSLQGWKKNFPRASRKTKSFDSAHPSFLRKRNIRLCKFSRVEPTNLVRVCATEIPTVSLSRREWHAKITRLRDSALRVKDSRTRVKKRTLFVVSADVYEIARRRKIDRVGRQKGATRVKRGGPAAYAS